MMEQTNFEKVFEEYKQQSGLKAQREVSKGNSAGKEAFVAVRKNGDGDIIAFKTNSGRELDYITAVFYGYFNYHKWNSPKIFCMNVKDGTDTSNIHSL